MRRRPSRRPPRGSVSLSGATYDRFKQQLGGSGMSAVLERLINDYLQGAKPNA